MNEANLATHTIPKKTAVLIVHAGENSCMRLHQSAVSAGLRDLSVGSKRSFRAGCYRAF